MAAPAEPLKAEADGTPPAAPAPSGPAAPGPPAYETAFQRVVGRLPDEVERARFHALRDALRLRETDALWAIFVALEHYLNLYERFPPMIHAAARELLVECKTGTDRALADARARLDAAARERASAAAAEVAEAARAARAALEKAIQQAARRIALKAGLAARWPWVAGGALAMALALILTGVLAAGFGRQQGYHQGYVEGQRAAEAAAKDRLVERPPPARGR